MWSVGELKERAKASLRRYYWKAFLVSLIFGLVCGDFFSSNSAGGVLGDTESGYESRVDEDGSEFDFDLRLEDGGDLSEILERAAGTVEGLPIPGADALKLGRLAIGIAFGVFAVILAGSLVMGVFVAPVLETGKNRFYLESRLLGRSAGVVDKLLWGFQNGYLKIVWAMFVRSVIVGLLNFAGGILVVLGGIFALVGMASDGSYGFSAGFFGIGVILIMIGIIPEMLVAYYTKYAYAFVPYLLTENPRMRPLDAMRLSKKMTAGHKLHMFGLDLSFIGWYFLGALLCGIGVAFVTPYVEAAHAELYMELRGPFIGEILDGGTPYENGGYGGGYGDGGFGSGYGNGGGYGGFGGYNGYNGYAPGNGYDGNPGNGYGENPGAGTGSGDGWQVMDDGTAGGPDFRG